MGSTKPINTITAAARRLRSKPSKTCSRRSRRHQPTGGASVSDKLEALRELVPSHQQQQQQDEIIKADQLYKETAEYIVLLKAQVLVLQKLVEHYGSAAAASRGEGNGDVDRETVNPDFAV